MFYRIPGKLVATSVQYDYYSASGKIAFAPRLPASDDHSLEAATELRVGHYDSLPVSDFLTINSLPSFTPGSSPTLPMFRVIRNNGTCDVNTGDLDEINQLLPPDTHAYYVVVTPSHMTPRIVIPKSCFTE